MKLRGSTVFVLVLAAVASGDVEMNVLRLRPQVQVRAKAVRAIDVLEPLRADSDLRRLLADATLAEAPDGPAPLRLGIDEVRERLIELGVNPARILLRGSDACVITFAVPLETRHEPPRTASDGAHDRTGGRGRAHATMTLAQRLRAYVQQELAGLHGEVEIEFELAGREVLDLTTPPFEFQIRPLDRGRLGLRRFSVTIRRDGRRLRQVRLAVRVRLVRDVLVAARPLNVGTVIEADALELAKREFVGDEPLGFQDPQRLIGQQVRRFIPAGQMLRPGDLKAADLVRRGRPVTVVQDGAVRLRVAGIALDSGTYGALVRVQLGTNRRQRRVVRGEVVGVATVRLVAQ